MAGLDEDNEPVVGGTPPAQPPAPPAVRVVGHGGEIPEERVSEIKTTAAARERKRLWREMWGTDDEEEVKRLMAEQKANADEAKKLKEEREKARLAELSESERLKQELAAEKAKYAADTARLTSERDQHKSALELREQDIQITGFASKHIAGKFLKTAKVDFSEYVEGLTKAQAAELDQKGIDKWFADYVRKNPEFAPPKPPVAKTAEELAEEAKKKAAAAPPAPRRAPIGAPRTAGTRPPTPAPKSPLTGAGTYKGKKVKDLSKAEFREYTKSIGFKNPVY